MNDFATDNREKPVDSGVETSNDSNGSGATRTDNNLTVSMLVNHSVTGTDSLDELDSSPFAQLLPSINEDIRRTTNERTQCTIEEIDQPGSSLSCDTIHLERDTQKSARKELKEENLDERLSRLINGKFRQKVSGFRRKGPYASRFREKYGLSREKCRHFGDSELAIAAITNNIESLTRLLRTGTSPNCKDYFKITPLHIASKRGYTEIVSTLLKYGADPNCRDYTNKTPLHFAAGAGHLSVVKLLLSTNTDLLAIDNGGYNPLQLAVMRLEILQLYSPPDVMNTRAEADNIVQILSACLENCRGFGRQVEALSGVCSRISLSNTADQVKDELRDLLSNIDALRLQS